MNNELQHYGVKGMKWGVRRNRGVTGTIRDIQKKRAVRDLDDVKSRQRQIQSELSELRGYDRNPSRIGKSKISTAIRRKQIKSLEKTQNELKSKGDTNKAAIDELDQIEHYQAKKRADKALKKMQKMRIKDLEKRYGELEDSYDYRKDADARNNKKIEREMSDIEKEMQTLKKRR